MRSPSRSAGEPMRRFVVANAAPPAGIADHHQPHAEPLLEDGGTDVLQQRAVHHAFRDRVVPERIRKVDRLCRPVERSEAADGRLVDLEDASLQRLHAFALAAAELSGREDLHRDPTASRPLDALLERHRAHVVLVVARTQERDADRLLRALDARVPGSERAHGQDCQQQDAHQQPVVHAQLTGSARACAARRA